MYSMHVFLLIYTRSDLILMYFFFIGSDLGCDSRSGDGVQGGERGATGDRSATPSQRVREAVVKGAKSIEILFFILFHSFFLRFRHVSRRFESSLSGRGLYELHLKGACAAGGAERCAAGDQHQQQPGLCGGELDSSPYFKWWRIRSRYRKASREDYGPTRQLFHAF